MSHLDEGTLHALLDGELELAEVSEIQLHLGACAACGSRLQEVKQVLAEADRLVGSVELPVPAARPRSEPPPRESSLRTPPTPPTDDLWNEPPVLLVPDAPDALARRRRWLAGLRWAAAIVVVVVGGQILADSLGPKHPVLPERDLTSVTPEVPPAVVSRQESRRAEEPAATAPRRSSAVRTPPPAARSEARPPALADQAPRDRAAEATPANERVAEYAAADTQVLASANEDQAAGQDQAAVEVDSVPAEPEAREETPEPLPQQNDPLATRQAAAEALAELDRQRIRERANAATAALPPPRPAEPAAESAPPPPAAPRTLQERSGIYLRIGLDEAAKQLGEPVHVIEGMSPQFIGLIEGRQVPGADPARPVVRVVYLDSRQRLIFLDQQRMRTDQAPGASQGNLRWALGEVMLYLRGEPSQQVLQSLQRRVR